MLRFASCLVLLLTLVAGAQAQARLCSGEAPTGGSGGRLTVQARRDQIAQVAELLADPDPSQRLANMECIVATQDTTLIERAYQIAFKSDDSNLHALGLRAYLATSKQISFTVILPPAVQAAFDAATIEPTKMKDFTDRYPWMKFVNDRGAHLTVFVLKYSVGDSSGTASMLPPTGGRFPSRGNNDVVFQITGDNLSLVVPYEGPMCAINVKADRTLHLRGTLSCHEYYGVIPRLGIDAPIQ